VPAPRKYPNELRERAMRLVQEAREQDPELSLNAAVRRIGPRIGINPDTLRGWCKQADIDAGRTLGTTTSDAARIKELEREVHELKRANETSHARISSSGVCCGAGLGGGEGAGFVVALTCLQAVV
jgi:transposase-like protein